MTKYANQFNVLWETKFLTKPIVVVYGGYAGTGKSTNCKMIMSLIDHSTSLPTGVIRSTIGDYLSKDNIQLLSSHTYDLHEVNESIDPTDDVNKKIITDRFVEQIKPISNAINGVINFAASEKQHILIDGNHVFPGLIKANSDVHLIEFYNKVSDTDQHYKMMCGPTHNRTLDKKQFATARILHDFTVNQCKIHNKDIFEYNTAENKMKEGINNLLESIVTRKIS